MLAAETEKARKNRQKDAHTLRPNNQRLIFTTVSYVVISDLSLS